jgi:hypothetical protein
VLDIRTNYGGVFRAFTKAFKYLHNGSVSWIGYGERNDPANRYTLANTGSSALYDIQDDDPHHFSGPIAVLTGPEAVSSGDFLPVLFQQHPNVRTFGRSTAGAFGSYQDIPLSYPNFYGSMQAVNFFESSNPNYYLSHTEYPVDQPTWLKQASVCMGQDNVVNEALNWINSITPVTSIPNDKTEIKVYPNPATDYLNIKIGSGRVGTAYVVTITDLSGRTIVAQTISKRNNIVDVEALMNGVYIITVIADNQVVVLKDRLLIAQ